MKSQDSRVAALDALIRRMLPEDMAEVVRIETENAAFPWSAGNFSDSLAAGHDCWVLTVGEAVIGYAITLSIIDEMHLLNVGVDRRCQRQGWGRRLLGWIEDRAAASAQVSVLLEVRQSNLVAQALYVDAGYVRIGIRKGYYPAHAGREDAWVMRKTLGLVQTGAPGGASDEPRRPGEVRA